MKEALRPTGMLLKVVVLRVNALAFGPDSAMVKLPVGKVPVLVKVAVLGVCWLYPTIALGKIYVSSLTDS